MELEKNQEFGYEPDKISYGSAIKIWWICKEGHEWEASPNKRSQNRGCPKCAKQKRKKKD
jgi:hypothetical protein